MNFFRQFEFFVELMQILKSSVVRFNYLLYNRVNSNGLDTECDTLVLPHEVEINSSKHSRQKETHFALRKVLKKCV